MHVPELAKDIYWIGKVDDRAVSFHRAILEKGTTYNSYLLKTGKPTVIDTVDPLFGREYIENLSKIMNPADIEYIVINHVEPDHAGALPALVAKAPKARIVCTEKAVDLLKGMFKLHNREFQVVRDGDTIDIGGKVLSFFEIPYQHTEETMMTYDESSGTLFPCDVFSAHIAAHEIFDDQTNIDFFEDAKHYYTLIMGPHRPYVRNMLEKVKKLNVKHVATSHGYVLRKDPHRIISMYEELSFREENEKEKKIILVYSTMTGNTGKIALRIAKGMEELGVVPEVVNLANTDAEVVRQKIMDSDGILVGSSTKYGDMVGGIEAFIKNLQGGDFGHKLAGAFGSYGWSGEAIAYLDEQLQDLGFKTINQRYLIKKLGIDRPILPLRIKFIGEEELMLAEEAGRIFAEQVLSQ